MRGEVASGRVSPLPRLALDPRTKLLALLLVNIVVFASPDLRTEWACMAAIGTLLVALGAYRQAVRGALVYLGMMGLLWLSGVFPGPAAAVGTMVIACFRKLVPTVYLASGLIATTHVSELVCALQKLRVPQGLIITLTVTLRFFPTAKEEFDGIRDAMRLRGIGLNLRNILTRPLTVMECALVPMVLRSAAVADELAAAVVARGIDLQGRRTSLVQVALRPADAVVVLAFTALVALVLWGGPLGLIG
ncbi:MAG: energy-coupling factor transporter transmembrane protein EcfT [Coriobacteriales bacterium]|jgi:energy-coupling factor transport system permease protein|nr:energy-coupling factor transporter transmembrane protein EcfT [Coriobacteriales bacterium]